MGSWVFDALADFGIFGGDGDDVVRGDVDEGGGDEILSGGSLGEIEGVEIEREEQAAGRGGGNFEEAAAIVSSG